MDFFSGGGTPPANGNDRPGGPSRQLQQSRRRQGILLDPGATGTGQVLSCCTADVTPLFALETKCLLTCSFWAVEWPPFAFASLAFASLASGSLRNRFPR